MERLNIVILLGWSGMQRVIGERIVRKDRRMNSRGVRSGVREVAVRILGKKDFCAGEWVGVRGQDTIYHTRVFRCLMGGIVELGLVGESGSSEM
jgi:hypothetical protein